VVVSYFAKLHFNYKKKKTRGKKRIMTKGKKKEKENKEGKRL